MKKANQKVHSNAKLHFRQVGSGFIMGEAIEGIPAGRKLAKTFRDQFDRTYVMINGELELVREHHCYLGAD